MRTHVEFRSEKFPSFASEEEGVNFEQGIYGKRLATYLQEKLMLKGIEVVTTYPEDWGWCVELAHEGNFPLFIGCGHYEEYEDGFLCFIEPSTPYIRKWFSKIDVSETVMRISHALDEILHEDKEIHSIKWWDGDQPA